MKESRIYNILRDIASDHDLVGGTRVCAAIVKNKSLISVGSNSYETHTLQYKYRRNDQSIFLHAEIKAISRARYRVDLTTCNLYVVRLMSDDSFGLAKPCSGCMKAIKQFGIKGVFHT